MMTTRREAADDLAEMKKRNAEILSEIGLWAGRVQSELERLERVLHEEDRINGDRTANQ